MKVKVVKMGINGEGIAYHNNIPIFIENALIEEEVNINITNNYKTYKKAEIIDYIKKSPYRIKPKCKLANICGGCNLMSLMVKKQLEYKTNLVKESLYKYANIDSNKINKMIPSNDYFGYRNQFKFPVKILKGTLYSGMFKEDSDHLVTIEKCIIHDKKLEELRIQIMNILNKYQTKDYYEKIESGLRYIILRGFNDNYQLTLVTGKNTINTHVLNELSNIKEIKSIYQNVNTKMTGGILSDDNRLLYGAKTIELKIDNLVFRLSHNAFFQLNYKQALNIYHYVNDLIDNCNTIVEAYSGIGAMSLMVANKANRVIGVEYINNAVKNANLNAKFNHLNDKVEFICDDAGKFLSETNYDIDYLIVDPPRSGLDDTMVNSILTKLPNNIIYISCNPSTLGKNLNELKHSYNIKSIQPFDMFTNTPHVETVCLLSKLNNAKKLKI